MVDVFNHLRNNISLCSLNISTIEGKNRNQICRSGINAMKNFFNGHKLLTVANLGSIGLKDAGLKVLLQILGSVAEKVNANLNQQQSDRNENMGQLAIMASLTKDDKIKKLYNSKQRL